MARRPRVLLVAPTYTHPADQGNSARIQAMGRHLQRRGIAVDLLYFMLDGSTEAGLRQMRATWNAVHTLPAEAFARQSYATCWGLDDWCPPSVPETVAKLQAQTGYDAVIVNYVWLSGALAGAGAALRVLDTHDLFGDRHRLAQRAGVEPNWYFTTTADENRGFDRADIVLAIQGDELRAIAARTTAEAMLVSHPMLPTTPPPARVAATFGYIGSSNPWNQRSVLQMDAAFAGRGVDWLLAGRICGIPQQLGSAPFILGEVADVGDFYAAISCSLNPMVEATGLKIKTIEALGHDVPVIGTDAAFAGLDARHPFHLCTDAAAVADAATEVAASDTALADLRQAGRALFFDYLAQVEAQYDALAARIAGAPRTKETAA